ncbi:MAG: HupE/UreJ family protein [Verrucomicrobiota bacterium]|nr:HupE/UreJ family protein [Verrucomicrobiota bacterium]
MRADRSFRSARSLSGAAAGFAVEPKTAFFLLLMRLLIVFLFLYLVAPVFAHDPGLSSANLRLDAAEISAIVTYNERDISSVLGETPEVVTANGPGIRPKLEALARRAFTLEAGGRKIAPATVVTGVDENKNVEFTYTYERPSDLGELTVHSALLPEMPFGHRQAFAAVDPSGKEIARSLLSNRETTTKVIPGVVAPSANHPFLDFLLLGIRHILTGYDHLLFLFGLLIVCRNLREAGLLITCFTIAHSITLALSTFGLVQLQSRWVESAIAASILYVGAENLLRSGTQFRGRWLLTFTFGLVHGLGFASVLREIGVANSGRAAIVPLVAFNSGVEIGQLCVAAIILPLILRFRKHPRFLRVGVPTCSVVVALAGAGWLVQRTFFG